MSAETPLVSIVCPVFNEQEAIPIFYGRVRKVVEELKGRFDFELLFVNNGSVDGTLDALLGLRRGDPAVQILSLSRNFGYQAALSAGLRHASGGAIVPIDVDCEDPPEMIPNFIELWQQGHDVVYGQRERRSEWVGMHLLRKLYYRVHRLIADWDIVLDMAEFGLVTAEVRDAILDNASTFPYLRAEVAFVGFSRKGVPYRRQRRVGGRTHYNFFGMARFAIGGFLSTSTLPLRLALYAGAGVVLANAWLLVSAVRGTLREECFRTAMLADMAFLGGVAGVLSVYLARAYKNGLGKPLYVVRQKHTYLASRERQAAA